MTDLDCHTNGLTGIGSLTAEVMVIGTCPGRNETRFSGTAFSGRAGQFAKAFLKTAGYSIDEDKVYMTNAICYWEPEPTDHDLDRCRPRLEREIGLIKPRLIIVMGTRVRDYLFPDYKRGHLVWSDRYDCWTMYTVSPGAILQDGGEHFMFDFARDIMKINDVLNKFQQGEAQWHVDYKVAHSAAEAQAFLDSLMEGDPEEPVAIDIESRYKTEPKGILCFGIAGPDGVMEILGDWIPELRFPRQVRWTTQNGIYDMGELSRKYGVELMMAEDVLLMDYSLDERGGSDTEGGMSRGVGVHGLKDQGCEYLGAPDWNIKDIEGTWDKGPEGQARVMKYNAYDAEYTRRLAIRHREKQEKDNVRVVYNRLMIPAANALREIRDYGVYIDQAELSRFAVRWIPEWQRLEAQLREESGVQNLGSPTQLAKYLYDDLGFVIPERWSKNMLASEATKGRTTNKYVLDQLAELPETSEKARGWLKMLKDWRKIDHLISTYVIGIEDDIEEDGRIHPDPKLHGTRTGRLAYNNPPVQTIPNHDEESDWIQSSEVRRIFGVPHPDLELMELDYKQAELWVAWMVSQDPALLMALETGDFHAATTKLVFGIEEGHPDFNMRRYDSKRVTFGIFYGRGANNLSIVFGNTPQYWQAIINKWEATYHVYIKYRNSVKREAITTGELVGASGRKRRFWTVLNGKNLNEAINMPIQATGHDFLLDSLIRLQLDKMLLPYGGHILFEVHDSIIVESPRNMRKEIVNTARDVMCEPKYGLPRGLQVDVKAGPNWYDVEKVKI